jgi:hypothetical protein
MMMMMMTTMTTRGIITCDGHPKTYLIIAKWKYLYKATYLLLSLSWPTATYL